MATTSSTRPIWTLPTGFPSAHLIRAAYRAGGLIDAYGSPVAAAGEAYLLYASDALFPPEDLRLGERLLVDCQLLEIEGDYLRPSSDLVDLLAAGESEAVAVILELAVGYLAERQLSTLMRRQDAIEEVTRGIEPDPNRREELLLRLARTFDATARRLLGERGEEHVVSQAAAELQAIGRLDLASRVRRVSGTSDQLGYDVIAPRVRGIRRLEVKTGVARDDGLFHFFLSRGEYETGRRDPDWALVACEVLDPGISVAGWSRAVGLEPYLPIDTDASRWATADVVVPLAIFHNGLPPLV